MHSIGNDIVDLNLAKTQSNWQRNGFLDKQFSQKEQQEIYNSKNPFLQVWQFWSMKEAAYKCYTQQVEKRFFAPLKFECTLISKDQGTVFFEDKIFYTTTTFNPFYVSTIAKQNATTTSIFSKIGKSDNVDKDLKTELASIVSLKLEEITKRKSSVGAPLYYYREKKITQSCSISHHGNYGAFAFTLNNEFERSTL
ncbi:MULTISPECIES: 4'-phosphopantetheinyl transferase family protein [Polaribacter]|uniref:4'-phosphopantetheinyl transferase superfamily protein n=1 Tax=Polaribacter marinaquae TaxID=1642819 RepID=A0ABZ2TNC6_9FLAO